MGHALLVNYIHYAPEYIIVWAILFASAIYMKSIVLLTFSVFIFITLLFFFRGWLGTPKNIVGNVKNEVLSCPCDGKVMDVIVHRERGYVQFAIFLNVHNIHIQYTPCHGTVLSVEHKDGEFHPAYMFEKSALNERTETIVGSPVFGKVHIVQIAGLVARRIVSMLHPGEQVVHGQPLGLIKLGSRVDVWVPLQKDLTIRAKRNDRIYIGDVLAYIK